jgi:hemerythrin
MEEGHVWSEKLELGQEDLDREHHLQVALVSGLVDAIERGRPLVARRLCAQLDGYTRAHFAGEELLMELAGYGQLDAHRQEHSSMLSHIEEIQYLQERGEYDLALPMAIDLLNSLASHISASDRSFAHSSEKALAPGKAATGS